MLKYKTLSCIAESTVQIKPFEFKKVVPLTCRKCMHAVENVQEIFNNLQNKCFRFFLSQNLGYSVVFFAPPAPSLQYLILITN